MIRLTSSVLLALVSAVTASSQTKLPTVDEAIELSEKTGRPIFAMAGQET